MSSTSPDAFVNREDFPSQLAGGGPGSSMRAVIAPARVELCVDVTTAGNKNNKAGRRQQLSGHSSSSSSSSKDTNAKK